MQVLPAAVQAALADGTAFEVRRLVWITARNRATNAPETLGLWEGEDDIALTIGGATRAYVGAGPILQIDPIRSAVGLEVRMQRITLSPIDQTVEAAVKLYDSRFAPVEIHRAFFDPLTGGLLAEPDLRFRGWIDDVSEVWGRSPQITATLASGMRQLTRSLTLTKSDAETRRRNPADRFREYSDISGEIGVWWGETRFANQTQPGGSSARSSWAASLRDRSLQ